MSNKQYTVAGIATCPKGKTKVRYANNLQKRLVTLFTNNFTDIHFVELPSSMSKLDACKHLLTLSEFNKHQDLINNEMRKINSKIKITAEDIVKLVVLHQQAA